MPSGPLASLGMLLRFLLYTCSRTTAALAHAALNSDYVQAGAGSAQLCSHPDVSLTGAGLRKPEALVLSA